MVFKCTRFILWLESFIISYLVFCVLLVHGHGLMGKQEVLNCDVDDVGVKMHGLMRSMLFEDADICCGNEKFKRGVGSLQLKFFDECNMEPKNETMCLEDSYWTFYECLVKKTLGSKELTQTSFVELLAQNLSDEKKSAILALAKDMKPSPMVANGNDQLQPIKSFWTGYFDAEYKVCTESSKIPESSKEMLMRFWDPSMPCKNGKFPKLTFLPITMDIVMKCVETYENKYPLILNASMQIHQIMIVSCALMQNGLITEDGLKNSDFDFEGLFTKALPKFYSKAVKERVVKDFLEQTRLKYLSNLKDGATAGIQEVAKEIAKSMEGIFSNMGNSEKPVMLLNAGTLFGLLVEAAHTYESMCGSPGGENNPLM